MQPLAKIKVSIGIVLVFSLLLFPDAQWLRDFYLWLCLTHISSAPLFTWGHSVLRWHPNPWQFMGTNYPTCPMSVHTAQNWLHFAAILFPSFHSVGGHLIVPGLTIFRLLNNYFNTAHYASDTNSLRLGWLTKIRGTESQPFTSIISDSVAYCVYFCFVISLSEGWNDLKTNENWAEI